MGVRGEERAAHCKTARRARAKRATAFAHRRGARGAEALEGQRALSGRHGWGRRHARGGLRDSGCPRGGLQRAVFAQRERTEAVESRGRVLERAGRRGADFVLSSNRAARHARRRGRTSGALGAVTLPSPMPAAWSCGPTLATSSTCSATPAPARRPRAHRQPRSRTGSAAARARRRSARTAGPQTERASAARSTGAVDLGEASCRRRPPHAHALPAPARAGARRQRTPTSCKRRSRLDARAVEASAAGARLAQSLPARAAGVAAAVATAPPPPGLLVRGASPGHTASGPRVLLGRRHVAISYAVRGAVIKYQDKVAAAWTSTLCAARRRLHTHTPPRPPLLDPAALPCPPTGARRPLGVGKGQARAVTCSSLFPFVTAGDCGGAPGRRRLRRGLGVRPPAGGAAQQELLAPPRCRRRVATKEARRSCSELQRDSACGQGAHAWALIPPRPPAVRPPLRGCRSACRRVPRSSGAARARDPPVRARGARRARSCQTLPRPAPRSPSAVGALLLWPLPSPGDNARPLERAVQPRSRLPCDAEDPMASPTPELAELLPPADGVPPPDA